jgi:hypothetical protein
LSNSFTGRSYSIFSDGWFSYRAPGSKSIKGTVLIEDIALSWATGDGSRSSRSIRVVSLNEAANFRMFVDFNSFRGARLFVEGLAIAHHAVSVEKKGNLKLVEFLNDERWMEEWYDAQSVWERIYFNSPSQEVVTRAHRSRPPSVYESKDRYLQAIFRRRVNIKERVTSLLDHATLLHSDFFEKRGNLVKSWHPRSFDIFEGGFLVYRDIDSAQKQAKNILNLEGVNIAWTVEPGIRKHSGQAFSDKKMYSLQLWLPHEDRYLLLEFDNKYSAKSFCEAIAIAAPSNAVIFLKSTGWDEDQNLSRTSTVSSACSDQTSRDSEWRPISGIIERGISAFAKHCVEGRFFVCKAEGVCFGKICAVIAPLLTCQGNGHSVSWLMDFVKSIVTVSALDTSECDATIHHIKLLEGQFPLDVVLYRTPRISSDKAIFEFKSTEDARFPKVDGVTRAKFISLIWTFTSVGETMKEREQNKRTKVAFELKIEPNIIIPTWLKNYLHRAIPLKILESYLSVVAQHRS